MGHVTSKPFRFSSPKPTAWHALSVLSVRAVHEGHASSRSIHVRHISPFKRHGFGKQLLTSKNAMINVQESKAPFLKRCVPWTCAVPATSDSRKRTCNMSSPQRQLTCYELSRGSKRSHSRKRGVRLLRLCAQRKTASKKVEEASIRQQHQS